MKKLNFEVKIKDKKIEIVNTKRIKDYELSTYTKEKVENFLDVLDKRTNLFLINRNVKTNLKIHLYQVLKNKTIHLEKNEFGFLEEDLNLISSIFLQGCLDNQRFLKRRKFDI